jgi:hypothetical protein
MTTPSWLPSWPSTWPDFEEAFARWIPAEWPRRLWANDSNGQKDTFGFARMAAQTRKTLEWVLGSVWPWLDSNELFQARWTEVFGAWDVASTIPRAAWLTALMRLRGEMGEDDVKAILIAAFGTLDAPTDLEIVSPEPSDLAAAVAAGYVSAVTAERQAFYAEHQNSLHVYDSKGTRDPDQQLFSRLSSLVKPTWQAWTVGRVKTAKYGATVSAEDVGNRGVEADMAVCSPAVAAGLVVGSHVVVAGVEVEVEAVNVGAAPAAFKITTWPFAGSTVDGRIHTPTSGGYGTACYGV